VRAERKAVSDKTGTIRFRMAEKTQSLDLTGHISCERPEEDGGCIEVESITLDEFCATHPRPDVIKCDVEGAELKALLGADNLLRTWHPVILCELHSAALHDSVIEYLQGLGYGCRVVDQNHILAGFE